MTARERRKSIARPKSSSPCDIASSFACTADEKTETERDRDRGRYRDRKRQRQSDRKRQRKGETGDRVRDNETGS